MNYPIFIFYELLIRLSEIDPEIGEYLSHNDFDHQFSIRTTNGVLSLPKDVLEKQFNDPEMLTQADLQSVVSNFTRMMKRY